MRQVGKWTWLRTTTGLNNSTKLRMEKIRHAVTEIRIPKVWQPPTRIVTTIPLQAGGLRGKIVHSRQYIPINLCSLNTTDFQLLHRTFSLSIVFGLTKLCWGISETHQLASIILMLQFAWRQIHQQPSYWVFWDCMQIIIMAQWSYHATHDYHYNEVIMSPTIVYSAVYSRADQRKYQSSASLAFVMGIHRWPMNSPHKGPVTRKMFPFDDVIMHMTITVMGYVYNHWGHWGQLASWNLRSWACIHLSKHMIIMHYTVTLQNS